MNFLKTILGSIMNFIYNGLQNFGVENEPEVISYYAMAILRMAVINKLITLPINIQQTKTSKKMAELQPKINEIKEKYSYDERILQQKLSELYKENGASPMGGASCLMMIVQIIIIFALYDVIRNPQVYIWSNLTEGQINLVSKHFFWIENIQVADKTSIIAIINSLSMLGSTWLSRLTRPGMEVTEQQQSSQNVQMFLMPIMFFFLFRSLPAALVIYWSFGNIVDIIFRGITYLRNKDKLQKIEKQA